MTSSAVRNRSPPRHGSTAASRLIAESGAVSWYQYEHQHLLAKTSRQASVSGLPPEQSLSTYAAALLD